jgi:hypothetical protein
MHTALRLSSLGLIAITLILLGADLIASLEKGGEITVRSVDQVWAMFSADGPAAFGVWADHHWPPIALHALQTVLTLPGWAVTGVPGVILNFVSGRTHVDA